MSEWIRFDDSRPEAGVLIDVKGTHYRHGKKHHEEEYEAVKYCGWNTQCVVSADTNRCLWLTV